MDWVEVEGVSKEEAEAKALERLGAASLDGLEIEEVKVTRRFLGVGGKVYKLRARLKPGAAGMENEEEEEEAPVEAEAAEPEERVVEAAEHEEEAPAPPDEVVTMDSKYRPWVTKGAGGVAIPRKGRGYGRKLYHPEPFVEEAPAAVATAEAPTEEERFEKEFVQTVYEDAEDSVISEETRQQAVAFVRQVLEDMGFEGETKGYRLPDRLMIQISTEDGGLLIGRKGETLESLQYLLDIIINRKLEHRVRIVLDTENYRERRKHSVYQKAKQAADDAVRTRRAVALAPMNPSERRIVHLALADDSRVETRSEGEGLRRRVVIHPAGGQKGARPKKNGGKGFRPRRRRA